MSFQYVPGRYRTTETEVAGEERRGEKQAKARAGDAEGSGDGRRLGRPAVGRVAVIARWGKRKVCGIEAQNRTMYCETQRAGAASEGEHWQAIGMELRAILEASARG